MLSIQKYHNKINWNDYKTIYYKMLDDYISRRRSPHLPFTEVMGVYHFIYV
ncbi:hypothetical protein H1P_1740019 [Hyella patelloides LEGE 07179]|uniref:Uncharacterized protein n=1 Tax=Hyella patelloides LEGE 07179 TaxID=945734 RepID=A0A563VNF7_9CYAN|nr:hypothetical protein H1P_1740019 [Hyella patelloides LEGE 07179]